ncbi:response regulator transcription factor [Rhodovulum sp. DZ06]|uniref:response regulator transcription factor n=1 Tax=Rhodovulum sp. DZ06 TaxID=3425126 RepID=UPI003D32F9A6
MKTVAIVEDEDSIALALRVLMEREGFAPQRYADGAEAVAAMSEAAPDLLLLDVGLPGLGGFAVCEALRRQPAFGQAPILMMSAAAGAHAAERAKAAGADDFLVKPFDARDLVARVRALMARDAGGEARHG